MCALKLPLELWLDINALLDDESQRNLPQTCHYLMWALQEEAYRYVKLDETAGSGRRLLALASGPRAHLVRAIDYSPHCPDPALLKILRRVCESDSESEGDSEDEGKGEEEMNETGDKQAVLSDETRKVLQTLRRFPGLTKFRFTFPTISFHGDMEDSDTLQTYDYGDCIEAYEQEPWVGLLEDSLCALALSTGAFKSLELHNIPPLLSESPKKLELKSRELPVLFKSLNRLEIDTGDFWYSTMSVLSRTHRDPLLILPDFAYTTLDNVQHLRISGCLVESRDPEKPSVPMHWQFLHLRQLKILELKHTLLDANFQTFLALHRTTLEKVNIFRCWTRSLSVWGNVFGVLANRALRRPTGPSNRVSGLFSVEGYTRARDKPNSSLIMRRLDKCDIQIPPAIHPETLCYCGTCKASSESDEDWHQGKDEDSSENRKEEQEEEEDIAAVAHKISERLQSMDEDILKDIRCKCRKKGTGNSQYLGPNDFKASLPRYNGTRKDTGNWEVVAGWIQDGGVTPGHCT